LTPGTASGGSSATIHRVGSADFLTTAVLDGGFDPVLINANVGDSIEVVVTDQRGAVVGQPLGLTVSARRSPVVVRTEPPPRKRDVPLNTAIVVVFSEPVAGASLSTASVQLRAGQSAVSGTVGFLDPTLDPTHVTAEFVPDAPLSVNTEYTLIVTQQVRDLDGDALAARDTATFITGTASTGAPASVEIPSDTGMRAGTTRQLRATVRDADGNTLTDQAVTWSSSDPGTVSVSSTGLLTAVEVGHAFVTASVNPSVRAVLSMWSVPGSATTLTVSPLSATVAAGDTVVLTVIAQDARGYPIGVSSLSSSDFTVAGVWGFSQGKAMVIGASQGHVTITAMSDTLRATASITVTPGVAPFSITPESGMAIAGGYAYFRAVLRIAGDTVPLQTVFWSNHDYGIVQFNLPMRDTIIYTVDTVRVTAVGNGVTTIRATDARSGLTAAVTLTVGNTAPYVTLGGKTATCGVVNDGRGWCWGLYGEGGIPMAVGVDLRFTRLDASYGRWCGLTATGAAYCGRGGAWAAVGGGHTFTAISLNSGPGGGTSSGLDKICARESDGTAYCWSNDSDPLAVQGLTFTDLSVGVYFVCGVSASGTAYCWGDNAAGQLGDNSTTASELPTPVAGDLLFAEVSSGFTHTCALTVDGTAYCWGANNYGQLGIGTNQGPDNCALWVGSCSMTPVAVQTTLRFVAIAAGGTHTCAISTTGAGYCWGSPGALGTGDYAGPTWTPTTVVGGLTFSNITAGGDFSGSDFSCGLTTAGIVYCWGSNAHGMLGDGSSFDGGSSIPVKVAGQQ